MNRIELWHLIDNKIFDFCCLFFSGLLWYCIYVWDLWPWYTRKFFFDEEKLKKAYEDQGYIEVQGKWTKVKKGNHEE